MFGVHPRWERTWQANGPAPALLLATLEDLQASVPIESLATLCNAWPGSQRIALPSFPRRSEVEQLRQAGFHHVLGKPLLIADLIGCLPALWARLPERQLAAS